MHDARDAEDTRLLESGEYAALVESYYGVILDRCRIKVRREDDAIDVAAEVFAPSKIDEVELEDWLHSASTNSTDELEVERGFDGLLDGLTELEQEVLRLRYVEDLDFQEIARRLGKEPNAVHQVHHRALTKLRKDAA
jgi:RNA polymerase sigma factor (sigma-70 family)